MPAELPNAYGPVEAQVHPLSTRWPKSAAVLAVLALGACAPDQTVSTSPDIQDFASAARNTVDYSSVTLSGEVSLKVGTSTKLSVRTSSRSRGSIKWQSSNPSAATVNSQGNVTGQSVGSAYVTASGFAVNETYLVSVTPAYTLTGFTLSPSTGTALAPGQTRQFSTQQLWSDGQTRNFGVTYTATGGSISSSGLFTAGSVAGSFMVIANCLCGALDTAFVTVELPAQLTKITVSPKTVSLNAGATQQFGATANWSTGATTLPPITWSATGGSISTSGLYTAPSTAGTYRVIVAHSGGTLRDTATVTVAGPTSPPPPSGNTSIIFSDDFESGTFGKIVNGTRWSSTPWADVSKSIARSGSNSARLRQGDSEWWGEMRFEPLPNLPEVFLEFYLYQPSGSESPSVGPRVKVLLDGKNDKFFRLWGGDVANAPISYGASTWGVGGYGALGTEFRFNDGSSMWGMGEGGGFQNGGVAGENPNRFPFIGVPSYLGKWVRVRIHCKVASPANNDGVIQIWLDDQQIYNRTNLASYSITGVSNYFSGGYLMGWSNTGFQPGQYMYIDDVTVSTGGFAR